MLDRHLEGSCYVSESGCCAEEAVEIFREFFAQTNPDGLCSFQSLTDHRAFPCRSRCVFWSMMYLTAAGGSDALDEGMLECMVSKKPRIDS